jgi:hypothetical protein
VLVELSEEAALLPVVLAEVELLAEVEPLASRDCNTEALLEDSPLLLCAACCAVCTTCSKACCAPERLPDCRSELSVSKSCSSADWVDVGADVCVLLLSVALAVVDELAADDSASFERVTKSFSAAEILPLARSVPSC